MLKLEQVLYPKERQFFLYYLFVLRRNFALIYLNRKPIWHFAVIIVVQSTRRLMQLLDYKLSLNGEKRMRPGSKSVSHMCTFCAYLSAFTHCIINGVTWQYVTVQKFSILFLQRALEKPDWNVLEAIWTKRVNS